MTCAMITTRTATGLVNGTHVAIPTWYSLWRNYWLVTIKAGNGIFLLDKMLTKKAAREDKGIPLQ